MNRPQVLEEDIPSLMLVEDDEILAQVLGEALSRQGFGVSVCNTTQAALRRIAHDPPEFAVVDLRLPDGSGLAVVQALKEADAGTCIVVLTGFGSIATAVEAIKLGAVNYLCKPVDADTVVMALRGGTPAGNDSHEDLQPSVPRLEWEYINRVLAENHGNISATARALRMHRRTLQRKLAKHPVRR